MSEPRADTPPLNWSDLGVSELPTGTVTLLLADVEGSTRLWETQPAEMTSALARLSNTLTDLVSAHDGVRPVEQGEGDSFVLAFARASDAVACALALQRAPLAPLRLRIGVHTGQIQLRDEGNYAGPTINRTARLRDLGHGGQTLLSGATEQLVVDWLPADTWLTDLGMHPLRDLPRPERVLQLCHPDVRNDFPPLRTSESVDTTNLPAQLTSFVGRGAQITDVRKLLADNRFVNLTGAGGAGKTRLAIEIAARIGSDFAQGVHYVDLAPVTHPDVVPVTMARALGLPDQPGTSTMDSLVRFIGRRQLLIVLDNCEHLLESSASLVSELLSAAPTLRLLATSREPLGVPGEVTFLVPSLSLADEAIELFADRARRIRPDFAVSQGNSTTVREICRRLDGMPLAIELAAARVRALSLEDILGSLHDRFRLLTGGARTVVRRQQTLRASVDWSHALLTESERILFRRLAVFLGGFELDAAQAVAGGSEVERYQVLDQLTLLVDKSLVVAENTRGRTRYRLLETVRQYALEKLGESGEAEEVRGRHRDHYASTAMLLDVPAQSGHEQRLDQLEGEIDNLRSAFAWSLETGDASKALELATSLQPLWQSRGRIQEGLAWLDAGLTQTDALIEPAMRARAEADKALLLVWFGVAGEISQAEELLTTARQLEDPSLLLRALISCGSMTSHEPDVFRAYFDAARHLARELGDSWRLCQILVRQAMSEMIFGNPAATRPLVEEALPVAEQLGDRFALRHCHWLDGWTRVAHADFAGAIARYDEVIADADAAHDVLLRLYARMLKGYALAYQGDADGGRSCADAVVADAAELGDFFKGLGYGIVALSCLADGDAVGACRAYEETRSIIGLHLQSGSNYAWWALAPLATGDLSTARRWADEVLSVATGCYRAVALVTRARLEIACGNLVEAERDAYGALALVSDTEVTLDLPNTLECIAILAAEARSYREAARIFGAADAQRQRTGEVRLKTLDEDYSASVAGVRIAMGDDDFDAAWAEGGALSAEEAIAYAQRGRTQTPRQWLGGPDACGSRRCASGRRRLGQQGHRRKAFHFSTNRRVAPPAGLQQVGPQITRAVGAGGGTPC
jgi:predicted ATPase/class 3 adenylate cyclase